MPDPTPPEQPPSEDAAIAETTTPQRTRLTRRKLLTGGSASLFMGGIGVKRNGLNAAAAYFDATFNQDRNPQPRDHLNIMSFNMLHGLGRNNQVDYLGLTAFIRELQPDILALQEVDALAFRSFCINQAKLLGTRLGMKWEYGAGHTVNVIGTEGVAILARADVLDVVTVDLPNTYGYMPRVALIGVVEGQFGHVAVAAVHLDTHKEAAEEQLLYVLEVLNALGDIAMVIGDFNLPRESVEPLLTEHGFVVAPSEPTFPNWDPRATIDHIATKGMLLGAAHVHIPPNRLSDHNAVTAVARLRGGRTIGGLELTPA